MIKSELNCDQVFGTEAFIINNIVNSDCSHWLTLLAAVNVDVAPAIWLSFAGTTPVLCHQGSLQPEALNLLREVGLVLAEAPRSFSDEKDAVRQIHQAVRQGAKIIHNFSPPKGLFAEESSLVSPRLLSWLNNKANLASLVPEAYVPRRQVVDLVKLKAGVETIGFPCLLKVATDDPTGGGWDVQVCHKWQDLEKACRLFSLAEQWVIEEYLEFKQTLCVNFAVLYTGEIRYLGTAAQEMDAEANYLGNWAGSSLHIPEQAISKVRNIVKRATDKGYIGFVGVDVGLLGDDEIKIFDLNFRLNGSTRMLLLKKSIEQHYSVCWQYFRSWQGTWNFHGLLQTLRQLNQNGILLPLDIHTQNPTAAKTPCAFKALVLGQEIEEVVSRYQIINRALQKL